MTIVTASHEQANLPTIVHEYKSPLVSITGEEVVNSLIASSNYVFKLPELSQEVISGRTIALEERVFKLHTQNGVLPYGDMPNSLERFKRLVQNNMEKSDLSIKQNIALYSIYERVVADMEQVIRIRNECSKILLDVEQENQVIKCHLRTGYGGPYKHLDPSIITFSLQYGPHATQHFDNVGRSVEFPKPSFTCWLGTYGAEIINKKYSKTIEAFNHSAAGNIYNNYLDYLLARMKKDFKKKDRLTFILPLEFNKRSSSF